MAGWVSGVSSLTLSGPGYFEVQQPGGGTRDDSKARQCINDQKTIENKNICIKTGKVNKCQSNGITLSSTETQIKRVRAL
jgi:hypothetical protein